MSMDFPENRPVVAVDIDGTVRCRPRSRKTIPFRVDAPADAFPDSPFLQAGAFHRNVHVRGHVLDWFHRVNNTGLVEFVWASAWEDAARTVFAPAVGLPDWPVAFTTRTHPPTAAQVERTDSAGWKAAALTDLYPGRSLVWLDDAAWRWRPPRREVRAGHVTRPAWRDGAPTLVVVPHWKPGLMPVELAVVDAFLGTVTRQGFPVNG